MSEEQNLKAMLRDFGRALAEAISDSDDVERSLERLQEEGYDLMLLVNCRRGDDDRRQFTVPAIGLGDQSGDVESSSKRDPGLARLGQRKAGDRATEDGAAALRRGERPAPPTPRDPTFRIDGRDLAFLRSMGIDPTRRLPTRRSRTRQRQRRISDDE
ncbi:MAG: hypothetical protein AAGD01_01095 [Acidobacteriota bacterium]